MKHAAGCALAIILLVTITGRPSSAVLDDSVGPAQEPAADQPPEQAEERALAEFLRIYRLDPDETIKHVPPPRPEGIRAYWKRERAGFVNTPDQFGSMTFRWKDPDRLTSWSMTTATEGFRLRDLPRYLEMDIYPTRIDGEADLLGSPVPGDWIYRTGRPAETMVRALEVRLQRTMKKRITLKLREVERDVVVVRGEYRSAPVPGRNRDEIEIYGKQIVQAAGAPGGGSGSYAEFLSWVGEWIERPVVSETALPPKQGVSWYYNARSPFTEQMHREDHDEALVLKHLQEQTGLTFNREHRPIPILFVERAK